MLKRILFLLILFYSKLIIAADDYVLERAYFEDKTGLMTFAEAKEQTYQKLEGILSKGYSKSTFWLRLKISEADQRPKDKLIVRIQPTYLDYIRLYDPEDLTEKVRAVGDKNINTTNDYESLNFNFFIPKKNYARYIYLQLKTTSTSFINVQALDLTDYIHQDKIQEQIFSFYIGILFILFLFPLIHWINNKEFLWAIFTIKQFGAISIVVFHTGALRLLLKNILPTSLDFAFNINLLIYSFITVFFHYIFLSEFKIKPWAKIYFLAIMICFPIELLLLLNGNILEALKLNMHVLNTLAFMFLLIPWFGLSWKDIDQQIFSRQWLITIHVLMFIFAVITTLPSLGYFQGNAISPFAGMFYGGITGILFIFVLQHRYRMKQKIYIAKATYMETMAQSHKIQREEQLKFLSMLTHELKTPLSILKMATTSKAGIENFKKHIHGAVADINQLIDRCIATDQLEVKKLNPKLQLVHFDVLVKNLVSEFKSKAMIKSRITKGLIIHSDQALLKVIIGNLLENSVKYGNLSQKVQVLLIAKNNKALLYVENALKPKDIFDSKKVFKKYYRGEYAQAQNGSGLGLYIAKNLVQCLGGTIECEIVENNVRFLISIPLKA